MCSFLGTYHVSALRELSQPLSATPLAEDTAACVCTYFLLTGAFVQLGLHVCIHTRLSCFINACVNTFLTYTRSSTAAKCQAPHDTRAYVCSMLISITTTSRYYSFQEVREAEPFSPFVVFFFFFGFGVSGSTLKLYEWINACMELMPYSYRMYPLNLRISRRHGGMAMITSTNSNF